LVAGLLPAVTDDNADEDDGVREEEDPVFEAGVGLSREAGVCEFEEDLCFSRGRSPSIEVDLWGFERTVDEEEDDVESSAGMMCWWE